MPSLPAICKNGHVSNSGIFIENSNNVTFSNTRIKCPFCQEDAKIPDGVYDFIADSIKFLSGPDISLEELKKLKIAIQKFKKNNDDYSKLQKIIQQTAPKFKALLSFLPENKDQLYAFLTLLLAVMSYLINGLKPNTEVIINNFYLNNETPNHSKAQMTDSANFVQDIKKFKNTSLNKPCPCGSKKLFKRCHGKKS